jgi:hypothetical protein
LANYAQTGGMVSSIKCGADTSGKPRKSGFYQLERESLPLGKYAIIPGGLLDLVVVPIKMAFMP